MKIKHTLTVMLLCAGIYQAAAAPAIISFDAVLSDPLKGGVGALSINPVTLEVESIIPFDERLEALNQPEAILARKYSYMMEADPEEYARLFPKSQEQKDYDTAALFDITHPLSPEERRARQTFEENALEDKVVAEMLAVKFVPDPDMDAKAPGPIFVQPVEQPASESSPTTETTQPAP